MTERLPGSLVRLANGSLCQMYDKWLYSCNLLSNSPLQKEGYLEEGFAGNPYVLQGFLGNIYETKKIYLTLIFSIKKGAI